MKKKLLSLLLVCTLVLGMIPGAALAADTGSPFKDVKTTDCFSTQFNMPTTMI